jgi:hypothetical protein
MRSTLFYPKSPCTHACQSAQSRVASMQW